MIVVGEHGRTKPDNNCKKENGPGDEKYKVEEFILLIADVVDNKKITS